MSSRCPRFREKPKAIHIHLSLQGNLEEGRNSNVCNSLEKSACTRSVAKSCLTLCNTHWLLCPWDFQDRPRLTALASRFFATELPRKPLEKGNWVPIPPGSTVTGYPASGIEIWTRYALGKRVNMSLWMWPFWSVQYTVVISAPTCTIILIYVFTVNTYKIRIDSPN